jgi:hypothetical protein
MFAKSTISVRWTAALSAVGLAAGMLVATQGPAGAITPSSANSTTTTIAKSRPGLEAFASTRQRGGSSATSSSVGGQGARGPRLAQLSLSPLMTVTYSLVKESDGNHPGAGSQVFLVFSANGTAYVYACNATEAEADNGSYSYSGGRLSLHIEQSDLKVNANFALDLSQSQVTMPFQIFSAKPGTSQWQQQPMGIDQGILTTYNAATNIAQTVSPAQAAGEAYAYAQAWVASENSGGTNDTAEVPARFLPAHSSRAPCGNYCIASVTSLGDDIKITYKNGQSVLVSLYNAAPSCSGGGCTDLTLSSLANDPRVFLDPTTHADSEFNPPNKVADFIAPVGDIEDPAALTDMATALEQRGYKVKELLNSDASLLAIANLLKAQPGFVLISTHGNTAGQLLTGQSLSTSGFFSASKLASAQHELATELTSEGLQSLKTFNVGGTPAYYIGEPNCSFLVAFSPSSKTCTWKVVITPTFWQWAESDYGANFSHSLVFISACETDATATLRNTIKARAYFAFTEDVASDFATAVERYLVEALWRPSHSPEETFYNMLRVEKTHQMIYKEDALLQGVMGAPGSDASFDIMDGWGWNGSMMVDYRGAGWLSGKVDAGEVWWMLYASRWSPNTATGAANLNNCYKSYWSHGNPGGLASPYCNAANAGIPSDPSSLAPDVAYAIYLLNGTTPAGFSPNQVPPRWTLDD